VPLLVTSAVPNAVLVQGPSLQLDGPWMESKPRKSVSRAVLRCAAQLPAPDGSGTIDDHGVHAFVVPLRDTSGNCLQGIDIRDCGYKARVLLHVWLQNAQGRLGLPNDHRQK